MGEGEIFSLGNVYNVRGNDVSLSGLTRSMTNGFDGSFLTLEKEPEVAIHEDHSETPNGG